MQSNMKIEQEKHWCCCHQSSLHQEQLQELASRDHLSKNHLLSSQINSNQNNPKHFSSTKQIFSFRDLQCRPLSPQKESSSFNRFKSLYQPSNVLTLSKSLSKEQLGEIRPTLFGRIEANSKPKLCLPMSPSLKGVKDPQITFTLTDKSHTPAGRANSQKVKFIMSNPNPPAKMTGKRIKTVEEETEYSSKHSQIHFKNGNECAQFPCFSFKDSFSQPQKQVFFKDDIVSENSHSFLNFPSCREVSAHQEVDNSVSNQLFQNARTMQTIVTSTEFKSRQPSLAFFNFVKSRQISKVTLKNSGDTAEFPSFDEIEHKSQLESIYQSPKSRFQDYTPDTSVLNSRRNIEKRSISPQLQSNMFYSQETFKKKVRSPKISVLNITEKQNSEEEELRDKIDHKYLESLQCSKAHSPFISINQSQKIVTDESKPALLRSSDHSREVSWELPLFKETLQQFKRTNTLESMNSSVSEHSLLDIKFIQKNRSRRGVSKLV